MKAASSHAVTQAEQLSKTFVEQRRLAEDGAQILRTTVTALSTVKQKYEPVKHGASTLGQASSNAMNVSTAIQQMLEYSGTYEKLDQLWKQSAVEPKLADILVAMQDTLDAQRHLDRFADIDTAVDARIKTRRAVVDTAQNCAGMVKRMLKTYGIVPSAEDVRGYFSKDLASRPEPTDVYFPNHSEELKAIATILHATVEADEVACVQEYVGHRQQVVEAIMHTVADSAPGAAPTGAQQERKLQAWCEEVRILSLVMEWERQLAIALVHPGEVSRVLRRVLSDTIEHTVTTGVSMCEGRSQPERLFPLLDMIAVLHEPRVLSAMKSTFASPTTAFVKNRFLELIRTLMNTAQRCLSAFRAQLSAADAYPLPKEISQVTSVSLQIAFTMRFLKNLFRRELHGRLPFLNDPRTWASETVASSIKVLDSKLTAQLRSDRAAVSVAMLSNVHFIVSGVSEHEMLPEVLGESWQRYQQDTVLRQWRKEYLSDTWAPIVQTADQAVEEANGMKKEAAKEYFRKINSRIERNLTTQGTWVVPSETLRQNIVRAVLDYVMPSYSTFWKTYEPLQLFKTPQKYLKYSPQQLKDMLSRELLTGARTKSKK